MNDRPIAGRTNMMKEATRCGKDIGAQSEIVKKCTTFGIEEQIAPSRGRSKVDGVEGIYGQIEICTSECCGGNVCVMS